MRPNVSWHPCRRDYSGRGAKVRPIAPAPSLEFQMGLVITRGLSIKTLFAPFVFAQSRIIRSRGRRRLLSWHRRRTSFDGRTVGHATEEAADA